MSSAVGLGSSSAMGRRLPAQRQTAAASRCRRPAAPVAALDPNVVSAVTQQGVAFGEWWHWGAAQVCIARLPLPC